MPPTPYAGHRDDGSFKLRATNPEDVAPADRIDYDPLDPMWDAVPGRAARAGAHPRADGRSPAPRRP